MSTQEYRRRARALISGAVGVAAMLGTAHADRKDKLERAEKAADRSAKGEQVALADILAAAIRKSPTMRSARADLTEGKERVTAAGAVDDWHIVGRAYGQDSAYPRALAGAGTALETRSLAGELGVQRSLPTGGDVALATAASQVNYLYPTVETNGMLSQTGAFLVGGTISTLRLTASQPLLRGAGESSARADQKLQKLAGRSQTADADDEASELVRDLVFAYWELAYATGALAVDREGEVLAIRQVQITQEVVKNGMQPPSAVKLAELQVALRREAILRDESSVYERSLSLRRLAGYEMDDAVLAPSDEPVVPDKVPAQAEVVAAALARGPGLAQKKLAQRGAEVTADSASNGALPRVDLSLSGELSGVGSSIGDAIGHIGTGQMYSVTGGVTVQFDVGGSARGAAARAAAHRTRLDAERADLDHELQASAMTATHQLLRARERVELSQVAVDAAQETLRAEIVAFQSGRSTNTLVFQRQDDVAQAKLRLGRARVDAVEADVIIDFLTGALLEHYGVAVAAARDPA